MLRHALLPVAVAAGLVGTATAHAAPVDPTTIDSCEPTFIDSAGGWFDLTTDSDSFGGFDDGGVVDLNAPPASGGEPDLDDSYDDFPALQVYDRDAATPDDYVDEPAAADVYSVDTPTCTAAMDDQEVVYPQATMHADLSVQRRVYVPASGTPGARLVDSVTNTSSSPRTVTIQLTGNLGSDDDTAVATSSDGTATMTPASNWAVTDDQENDGDAKLSHVWNGPGAPHPADAVGFYGGGPGPGRGADIASDTPYYRYEDLTVPAGGTVSVLTYEVQSADASGATRDRATEDALATERAQALEAQDAPAVFTGLDAGTAASVVNWAQPVVVPVPTAAPVETATATPAASATPAATTTDAPPPASTTTVAPPCKSVRHIVVHVRGRFTSGTAKIAGKRFTVKFGKHKARVGLDLSGQSKGTYVLKMRLKSASGRTVSVSRTYRTCRAKNTR